MTVSIVALVISLSAATLSVWDWRRTRRRLHEWRCPNCGATTRARMADR